MLEHNSTKTASSPDLWQIGTIYPKQLSTVHPSPNLKFLWVNYKTTSLSLFMCTFNFWRALCLLHLTNKIKTINIIKTQRLFWIIKKNLQDNHKQLNNTNPFSDHKQPWQGHWNMTNSLNLNPLKGRRKQHCLSTFCKLHRGQLHISNRNKRQPSTSRQRMSFTDIYHRTIAHNLYYL